LSSTTHTRQFEFHPESPDSLLVGRNDGSVAIVDTHRDRVVASASLDTSAVLGLCWIPKQPDTFVCGLPVNGKVVVVRHHEDGEMVSVALEAYDEVCSTTVNCSSDYLLLSGFSRTVALYDLPTGRRIQNFTNIHTGFVNISRFAHQSPHLFATASFDATCKVWDLRRPVLADKAVRTLVRPTLNVMCTFSHDDRHLLVSGVDSSLGQYSVDRNFTAWPDKFEIPSTESRTNYRRSVYNSDSSRIVTAATDSSVVHVLNLDGTTAGDARFAGILNNDQRGGHASSMSPKKSSQPRSPWSSRWFGPRPRGFTRAGSIERTPRALSSALSRLRNAVGGRSPGGFSAPRRGMELPEPADIRQDLEVATSSTAGAASTEYVQSVRGHPSDPMRFGALIASPDTNTMAPGPKVVISRMKPMRTCVSLW